VESEPTPAGGAVSLQVPPPSFVTMMEATWPPSSPTATQVAEVGEILGAQDTERTFAIGGEVKVVCQLGVAAAAGGAEGRVPRTAVRARASTVESATTVRPRTLCTATSSTREESFE